MGSAERDANSTSFDRPHLTYRLTPLASHHRHCKSHPHIPPTTTQHRLLQQLHLAGSYTLGRMSLRGRPCIASSSSTPPRLFPTSRPVERQGLRAGTDSLEAASTELERPPKDSRGPVAERPENSPEIPETPTVALESVRRWG